MFLFDLLALVSIGTFLVLALVTAAAAPRRDLAGPGRITMGCVVAGTVFAYSAATLPLFLAGWTLAGLPMMLGWTGGGPSGPRLAWLASTLLLATGAVADSPLAPAALMMATMLRQGLFPFHRWTLDAFETPALAALSLFLNGHLGAYVLMRFTIPLFPAESSQWLPYLGALALFSSVFMAIAALARPHPRRILGLLWISQASFIVAGLGNRSEEGITGALVHWWVVAFAMSGLMAAYRALEARNSAVRELADFLGLGLSAPRLSAFFAVCGLALVGLPGTLGFVAEDLLFHGALSAHFLLGVSLPLATALNAITVFRLFTTLFMGRRAIHATPVPDAAPRESAALAVTAILLIASGLAPGVLIALRSPSAIWLAGLLSVR